MLGVCRRYPQLLNKHENDWCGEHKNLCNPKLATDVKAVTEKNILDYSDTKTGITESSAEQAETNLEVKEIAAPKKRGRKKLNHGNLC